MQPRQRFVPAGKDERITPEIKRRITAVNRAMMVRTDEHEVC
jgi:hypothetical protein